MTLNDFSERIVNLEESIEYNQKKYDEIASFPEVSEHSRESLIASLTHH